MSKRSIKAYFNLALKGMAMGTANVIPGVSGGTIALITGIFEELIDSIKSLDLKAIKLLLSGKLKEFAQHINLFFLMAVFTGIGISIFSLAKLLDFLFDNYPVYIWSYFFGLILASVYFVGLTVKKWKIEVVTLFVAGVAFAVAISLLNPATENDAVWYVFLCGIVAVCSMILPGLSGSFVLLLMGNYKLVMIDSINEFNVSVLIPLCFGAVIGLIAFSHFLSWIFKKYKDHTIAVLTGFILGSLFILWPWKNELVETFANGKVKVVGYERFIPDSFNQEVNLAIVYMLIGILTIYIIEKLAKKQEENI